MVDRSPQPDPVAAGLAEALRYLLDFVENRPEDATFDDDVKALEDAAATLHHVPAEHQQRLVDLLGHRHSRWLGLIE
jgi:hypothetical protein